MRTSNRIVGGHRSLIATFGVAGLTGVLSIVLTHQAPSQDAPAAATATEATVPAPPAWPRTFEKGGNTLMIYQPQVDQWDKRKAIKFRSAIALTQAGSSEQHVGVVAVKARTTVDHDARMVLMTKPDVAVRFPGLSADKAAPLKELVRDCLPNLDPLEVSLDHVLAYLHKGSKAAPVDVSLAPPPILFSDVPAILVIYMGEPQFKPIKDTSLLLAVNTNWPVFLDTQSGSYFLLDGPSWFTSTDPLKGPWTAAAKLPADLSKLPPGPGWDEVLKNLPGKPATSVPRVLTATTPTELILTNGWPEYSPIAGTRLVYVTNPQMPLFLDLVEDTYYFLASGRWFRTKDLTKGPWTAASTDLPAEFAKIPPDGPMGPVLAAVPNTQEAKDAALLATVPHTATVKLSTTVDVTYDGPPKFAPIQGTNMTYATNTPYEVIALNGVDYCCNKGVWFTAAAPTGPWKVATSVPKEIYTIPPSSPVYNTTYVQVYDSDADSVDVGYTDGYCGDYVGTTGTLMFGAGLAAGAVLADGAWYGCWPSYYSYGCAAHYGWGYGGYYRAGAACYGPYGGAGWAAGYNPATGTWARGGAAYGPHGAAWGAQAYNPFTNTYAAHAGASNGYQSWGASCVQHGDSSTVAAHTSTARGSAGWAETSSGQWATGVHSNVTDSSLARTSSGNMYASHDGNVYKNTDGSWQKYQGGGNWSDTGWNKPTPASYSHQSSAAAESSWQSSMQSRGETPAGWSGDDSDGWKSNFENRSDSGGGGWQDRQNQQDLDRDSWARDRGDSNAFSSWGSREGGFGGGGGGGGGRFGGGGGGWGGGGRFGGGGFGRRR